MFSGGPLGQRKVVNAGKRKEMTDTQTGTETKKLTFTDAVKNGRLPQDLLSKGPVEQLDEVYGKELNRL